MMQCRKYNMERNCFGSLLSLLLHTKSIEYFSIVVNCVVCIVVVVGVSSVVVFFLLLQNQHVKIILSGVQYIIYGATYNECARESDRLIITRAISA